MGDFRQIKFAALFHRGKEVVEVSLTIFWILCGTLEKPWKETVWQELNAMGEKAENELINKMGNFFLRPAPLQPRRDSRKFICRFLCDTGACFLWPQLLRIEKDRMKNVEVL